MRPFFFSGGGSSSAQLSPSHSDQKEKKEKDRSSSSVEDLAHTAADESLRSDSIHSLLEEKGKTCHVWDGQRESVPMYNL